MSLNQGTRKGMPLPYTMRLGSHVTWERHPLAGALAPCQMLFDSLLQQFHCAYSGISKNFLLKALIVRMSIRHFV